jgi:hypothetical protein
MSGATAFGFCVASLVGLSEALLSLLRLRVEVVVVIDNLK